MNDLQPTEFDFILEYLREKRELDFLGNRSSMLERRIGRRLIITGFNTYRDYFEYLQKNDGELTTLIDVLTINVSRFFRDTLVFDTFDKIIIPELIREKMKQTDPTIRI